MTKDLVPSTDIHKKKFQRHSPSTCLSGMITLKMMMSPIGENDKFELVPFAYSSVSTTAYFRVAYSKVSKGIANAKFKVPNKLSLISLISSLSNIQTI